MTYVCPIAPKSVNEHVTRFNAGITCLLVALFIFTPLKEVIFFLVADFALRIYYDGRFSPLVNGNKYLVKSLKLKPAFINAGPKIFAAKVGLIISVAIAMFYLFDALLPAIVLAYIIALFAFLEATMGFCVACKLYPFVYRTKPE